MKDKEMENEIAEARDKGADQLYELSRKYGQDTNIPLTKSFNLCNEAAYAGSLAAMEKMHEYYETGCYSIKIDKAHCRYTLDFNAKNEDKASYFKNRIATRTNKLDAQAQYDLAQCYEYGIGTKDSMPDYYKAYYWYIQVKANTKKESSLHSDAAKRISLFDSSAEILYQMGLRRELGGNGVSKNIRNALIYYKQAADKGHIEASKKLEELSNEKHVPEHNNNPPPFNPEAVNNYNPNNPEELLQETIATFKMIVTSAKTLKFKKEQWKKQYLTGGAEDRLEPVIKKAFTNINIDMLNTEGSPIPGLIRELNSLYEENKIDFPVEAVSEEVRDELTNMGIKPYNNNNNRQASQSSSVSSTKNGQEVI